MTELEMMAKEYADTLRREEERFDRLRLVKSDPLTVQQFNMAWDAINRCKVEMELLLAASAYIEAMDGNKTNTFNEFARYFKARRAYRAHRTCGTSA